MERPVEDPAEKALAAARRRIDSALLAGDVGTYDWDIANDRVYGDENFARLFGITLDGAGAAPIATYLAAIHPDDLPETRTRIEHTLLTGALFESEYRVTTGGRDRWVIARGGIERDSAGKPVRFPGVIVDITERRRAEEALRVTEERYRTLFNSIDQGFCVIEVLNDDAGRPFDYRYEEVNPAFERQSGLVNAAGQRMRDLVPDFDRYFPELYGRVARTGEPIRAENEVPAMDRWFDVNAFRVGSPDDPRVAVLFSDITERHRAARRREELLRAVEAERANLTAVVEQSPAFMCVLRGPLHVFELANDKYYDLIGRRSILGKTVRDALPEIEGQGFFELLDAVYRTGDPSRGSEVPVNVRSSADGQLKHARIDFVYQALRGADGAVNGVFVHGIDVTDSVRARDAVQFSERQRRLALDSAELGEWHIDAVTHELTSDERFRSIFGIDGDAATYEQAFAAIHPQDRERVRRAVAASMRVNDPVPYADEHRIAFPDGSVRWVFAKGRANFVGEGAQRRLLSLDGTIADITDRKTAEAERQELLDSERAARAEAEQAGRMKDEFLATLSHELRTPLNAIVGWIQILKASGGTDAEDLAQGLEVIDRNARAQTQIIEDILDMSRIISGKLRLDVQRVNLAALVQASVETVQPASDGKSVRLQMLLDPAAGPISGDPNRLQQVFWNLLSNAVKFTPKGGRVQVRLERINSHVEVSVADTGEGIDPEFLPHVFDRFRQADASTTRRHGGLGLGLAIVKQLVELHGGSVSVHSAGAGKGSTFIVALPLAIAHDERQSAAPPREHPRADVPLDMHRLACQQLEGVDVLAVDDEPDASLMMKRLLEDCGAIVRTAGSASEAMTLFNARTPHVLISDIGMPMEDGYSLIRKVRALPRASGGRVHALALTAYARAADRVKALEAGFQMHLAKPVEPIELIVTVASLAKQSRESTSDLQ